MLGDETGPDCPSSHFTLLQSCFNLSAMMTSLGDDGCHHDDGFHHDDNDDDDDVDEDVGKWGMDDGC